MEYRNQYLLIAVSALVLALLIAIASLCYAQRRTVQPQHWIPLIIQEKEPATPVSGFGLIYVDPNGQATYKDKNGRRSIFAGTTVTYNINNLAIDTNVIYVDAVNDSIGFFTNTPAAEAGIQYSDKFVICDTFTSAGVQACVTALGGPGEVYCPKGTYLFSEQVTLVDGVTIRGAGDATLFQRAADDCYLFYADEKTGITLRDFKIDGQEASFVNPGFAEIFFEIVSGNSVKFENLTIVGYEFAGIDLTCAGYYPSFDISGCRFEDTTNVASAGARILAGTECGGINHCTFRDIAGKAIYIYTDTSGGVAITDNRFYKTGNTAASAWTIHVYGLNPASRTIISNNILVDILAPIRIESCKNTIEGNIFNSYATNLLYVTSPTGERGYNKILNNFFMHYDVTAPTDDTTLHLEDTSYNTVSGNVFRTQSTFEVEYYLYLENADNNLIEDNRCIVTGAFPYSTPDIACLKIDADSTDNVLVDNDFPTTAINAAATFGDYKMKCDLSVEGDTKLEGNLNAVSYDDEPVFYEGEMVFYY